MAVNFLRQLGRLTIEAAGDVTVDGITWPLWREQEEGVTTVARDDVLDGLVIAIRFERTRVAAMATVVVLGLKGDNDVRCGDARTYTGKYRR